MAPVPVLPQDDTDTSARATALADAQQENPWSTTSNYFSPLAFRDTLPPLPNAVWTVKVTDTLLDLGVSLVSSGTELIEAGLSFLFHNEQAEVDHVKSIFSSAFNRKITATQPTDSLEAFNDLFGKITPPQIDAFYPGTPDKLLESDVALGWMRVAGPNPGYIKLVTSPDESLTQSVYENSLYTDGGSLTQAISDKKIFIADYSILQGATPAPGRPSILGSKVYYVVTDVDELGADGKGILMPVAIAVHGAPVLTPSSTDQRWQLARMVAQCEDILIHELLAHLGQTHLLMEAVFTGMVRYLAPTHPIHILLTPHLEGTFLINWLAVETLVADSPIGVLKKVFWPAITETQDLAVALMKDANFTDLMLPNRLAANGVTPSNPPFYPYRDWATKQWDAIAAWAESYLELYYKSDDDVTNDPELQKWAVETRDFCSIGGFGSGSGSTPVTTRSELTLLVTMCIFQASVEHAAVNFPQRTVEMASTVYQGAFTKPLDFSQPLTGTEWISWMPKIENVFLLQSTLYLLGSVYYTTLGEYDSGSSKYFEDPNVQPLLADFQAALKNVNTEMANPQAPLGLKYDTLRYENIPQSINI